MREAEDREEEQYLIRSCALVWKGSAVKLLVLVSGEQIRRASPRPHSGAWGLRSPRTVAQVCSRPLVRPSNTCLFTLRPKMDLSSSGT